jgi:hypothetical protein
LEFVGGLGVTTGFSVGGLGHGLEVGLGGVVVHGVGVLPMTVEQESPHMPVLLPPRADDEQELCVPPANAAGAAAKVRTDASTAAPRMFRSFTSAFPPGTLPGGHSLA